MRAKISSPLAEDQPGDGGQEFSGFTLRQLAKIKKQHTMKPRERAETRLIDDDEDQILSDEDKAQMKKIMENR